MIGAASSRMKTHGHVDKRQRFQCLPVRMRMALLYIIAVQTNLNRNRTWNRQNPTSVVVVVVSRRRGGRRRKEACQDHTLTLPLLLELPQNTPFSITYPLSVATAVVSVLGCFFRPEQSRAEQSKAPSSKSSKETNQSFLPMYIGVYTYIHAYMHTCMHTFSSHSTPLRLTSCRIQAHASDQHPCPLPLLQLKVSSSLSHADRETSGRLVAHRGGEVTAGRDGSGRVERCRNG
ncbi:hypothetical protein IWX91DRAFT_103983 [Phyllosticta citricarpa]